MINISLSHTNLDAIAEEWAQMLWKFLTDDFIFDKNGKRRHRTAYHDKMLSDIDSQQRNRKSSIQDCDEARENLDTFMKEYNKIVLADEEGLQKYSQKYHIALGSKSLFKDLMIALYNRFTDEKRSYHFFEELNVRTCPYCNREYTFTFKKGIKTRPQFDHFYDKSEYPMLTVSFYNLVPSCPVCNKVKGTNPIKLNPYFLGFKTKFRIADDNDKIMNGSQVLKILDEKQIHLKFSNPSEDEKSNIEQFGLEQLYNMHSDYVEEMIERAVSYNDAYKKELLDAFQSSDYSLMDIYDFVWGRYLDIAEQERRPLSKLTRDLLEQMEIE